MGGSFLGINVLTPDFRKFPLILMQFYAVEKRESCRHEASSFGCDIFIIIGIQKSCQLKGPVHMPG